MFTPVSYTHLDVYKRQGLYCNNSLLENKTGVTILVQNNILIDIVFYMPITSEIVA